MGSVQRMPSSNFPQITVQLSADDKQCYWRQRVGMVYAHLAAYRAKDLPPSRPSPSSIHCLFHSRNETVVKSIDLTNARYKNNTGSSITN